MSAKASKAPTIPKRSIDWDLVAADYRAGVKTTRQIGAEYGISHTMVNKRAKADGWSRDLAEKIKAKAEEKVSRAAVSKLVSTATVATENQVVEANAELQKQVRLEHRVDIKRARSLFRALMEELEAESQAEGQALIAQLAEMANPPQEDEDAEEADRRRDRMQKMLRKLLDGPARIDSAKKLTEMLEKVVRLEREAFGIDKDKGGDGGYEDTLRRVIQEAAAA